MQLNSSYLYPNRIDVFTSLLDSWTSERYRRVYNRNLKIYRGVDNRIDIQVKNSDQKSISVATSYLVFNLVTREGKNLVIKKDCTLLADDPDKKLKGRAYVILTRQEMLGIETGFYDYSLVIETRSTDNLPEGEYKVTSSTALYMDSQYDAIGTIEVGDDVSGEVEASLEIKSFLLSDPVSLDSAEGEFYVSGVIDTNRVIRTAQSLHTFQFYLTGFTGTIEIQGSMDASSTPKNWTVVAPVIDLVNANSHYENVVGKWNWFRIKHSATDNGTAKFTVGQTESQTYTVSVYDGGAAYKVGDVITIIGTSLGGLSGVNDLNITVTAINYAGSIVGISWNGTSIFGTRSFVLRGTGLPARGTVDKVLYR